MVVNPFMIDARRGIEGRLVQDRTKTLESQPLHDRAGDAVDFSNRTK